MVVWRRERARRTANCAVGCVGLLAAVLGLSGCSGAGAAAQAPSPASGDGPGDTEEAREAVRGAADGLERTGSSQVLTALQLDSGGTRITIHGEGGFDYGRGMGELLVTPSVDRGAEDLGPVTEVFSPGRLFMKNRGAGVPPDKWIEIDVTTLPDGNLVTGGATDPITAAELLRGVREAVDLGPAEVDGEQVRHYRGTTDIAAAAEAASGRVQRQLAAAVAGFSDTEVPFDAYLDGDGRLRQVQHRFSFLGGPAAPGESASARPESQPSVDVSATVVFYGFGSPVTVRPPEADEIHPGAVVVSGGRVAASG